MTERGEDSTPIVVSIQSSVAYGHAGNSAAVFPMQRLGVEVWPVHTVQLSNHTGYEDWSGGALGADHVADVLTGLERRGGLRGANAVLSGYLGTAQLARVVAGAIDRMRQVNRDAIYCCDPVVGNRSKGLFVPADAARAVAEELIPRADLVTPNRFELAWLTARAIENVKSARAAADKLANKGPSMIIVTSIPTASGVGTLVRDATGSWLIETPRLDTAANGAGDAFAAILLARLVAGKHLAEASAHAAASVFGILSHGDDYGELPLIRAQHEIATPTHAFTAERID